MPSPVVTCLMGSSDISARVGSEPGGASVRFGRGGNFDGSAEAPGYAVVTVRNDNRAFNPLNGSSPYIADLKLNKLVRLTATHSAVTYYLFHGFLRRIVPLDNGYAELHCEDALHRFGRANVSIAASTSRSVENFRDAILDDMGETAGNRNLALSNAEAAMPFTGADHDNALALLEALNHSTGTLHFCKPDATAFDYTTLDRLYFEGAASVETWSDADMANPFAERLIAYDYTDEGLVNSQRVEAAPRALGVHAVLWESASTITVNASTTETIWAEFADPAFTLTTQYVVTQGAPTVGITPYYRSAKVDIIAGGTAVVMPSLAVLGYPAAVQDLQGQLSEDASSISTYGRFRGTDITTEYTPSRAWAYGLAQYWTWRYATPRAKPGLVFVNRFPTQLAREVGDCITLTSSELSLTAARMFIKSFETAVTDSGSVWSTTYQLEEAPAALNLFTVGGTAGQGVGGSGQLGY